MWAKEHRKIKIEKVARQHVMWRKVRNGKVTLFSRFSLDVLVTIFNNQHPRYTVHIDKLSEILTETFVNSKWHEILVNMYWKQFWIFLHVVSRNVNTLIRTIKDLMALHNSSLSIVPYHYSWHDNTKLGKKNENSITFTSCKVGKKQI